MPVKFRPGYMYSGSPGSMAKRAPYFTPTRRVTPRKPAVGSAPLAPPVDPYGALSTAEIDKRASALANAGLKPQQDEVTHQQEIARQNAIADEKAIQGFQTAAGTLLGQIPQGVSDAYQRAAQTEGAIGTGVGGQVGADLAAKAAANDAFAASQGQTGGTTVDPTAAASTIGMLGGVIPGGSLAEEGAARAAQAQENVAIPLNAGREELDARMAQARHDNDQYAQQLIQLASQFPGLKAQALQQLNQYEIDKANYRRSLASDAEQKRVDTANIIAQRSDTARQNRAEIVNEQAVGLASRRATNDAAAKADLSNYRWASLDFQSNKARAAAKAAASKGKRIDVGASRLMGHIVYKDGTEDPSIKVKQTAGTKTDPAVKAQYNRAKATQTARTNAFKYASTLLGKPTAMDKKQIVAARADGKQIGLYVAGPDEKYGVPGGVFKPAYPGYPATTNNPARAARTGAGATDYADAQTKTWAAIGGDSLMARFGYSREQVMAIVNRALAAAGWKRR